MKSKSTPGSHSSRKGKTLFVGVVTHEFGVHVVIGATRARVYRQLREGYVAEWWEKDGPNELFPPKSVSDEEVVSRYFEAAGEIGEGLEVVEQTFLAKDLRLLRM